ncbi:hypothetical protein T492DRAFT_995156 [Pavlovales sp. CCMP2436]|nr:hypothetical protein T492DRAFT_995156 [Pavlovales sp. CCMP2436]
MQVTRVCGRARRRVALICCMIAVIGYTTLSYSRGVHSNRAVRHAPAAAPVASAAESRANLHAAVRYATMAAPVVSAAASRENTSLPTLDDPPEVWRASLLAPEAGAEHAQLRRTTFEHWAKLQRALVVDAPPGGDAVEVDGQPVARRFVVVRPCCQLCNRLRTLVSSIALGILTDRAVLIDFEAEGYYGRLHDLYAPTVPLDAHLVATPKPKAALSWEFLLHGFLCDSAAVQRGGAGTLEVHGAPCFLHALHLHPALSGRFREAFGGPEGLFAAIYRHFLPLERSLQARIDASFASLIGLSPGADAVHAGRPLTVGVHVRNGGDFRSAKLSAIEWARLARSALELLPIERRAAAVFFVAADGAASRETARETFANLLGSSARVLLLPGLAKRTGCKADDADCTVSREGARVSLLELSLLAACNVRVLSPMSSFSEMAAAVSARRAAYFHPDLQRKFHYETAVEVLPRVFVPHSVEMPASIALGRTLDALTCGPAVRAAAGADDVWTRPRGLIFLNGSRAMPHTLARKYASID